MTLFPVIDRELRLRSRQGATYWTRCAVATTAAMVALEELALSANALGPTRAGANTFEAVSWLGFLVACGSALVTADCLSRERREGTLGLLLLTELKGFDVVLGKLCVAGLAASYALIGFLPALGLILLAGGVSLGLFARTSLALLFSAFLALAAGMWVSARAHSRSSALRGTLLFVLLLCIVPRILMNFGRAFTPKAAVLAGFSPFTAFYLAPDSRYYGDKALFWLTLCLTHLAAWALLVWTSLRLARNWRAVHWSPPPQTRPWEPLAKDEARALAAARTALMQDDPICWAVSRLRIQNALIWLGTLLLLLGGTGFSWAALVAGPSSGIAALGIWNSLHLLFSLGAAALLAWAAGRFFFETQRNGELELLLSTPLGARDIVSGNWRALCQPLRGAWLLVGFLIVLEFVSGAGLPAAAPVASWAVFQRTMAPIVRVLDIVALCWMGMWFGLRARRPLLIIGWTVGLVVGFPWFISYLFIIAISMASTSVWGTGESSWLLWFWCIGWPILNVAKDILFIRWAASKLRAELRTTASLAAGELLK